jgi:cytochrome c-type biogenesis protein CcmH/NrfG
VQIESGASVLQVETQSPTVSISPGILKAGARYYWDVRTLDRAGQAARGAAEFMTLDGETVRARAALKESIDAAGDAQSLAFLGEIDRHLGLLTEARDAFRAAVAKAPDDVALRHALERLEQQLGGVRER